MHLKLLSILLLCLSFLNSSVIQTEAGNPPEGFQALVNGKDFTGWHGLSHFAPEKLKAMSKEERETKRAKDLKDMNAHWTLDNGVVVNDGKGVYLTTDKEFGDIEFLIDYKTAPKADSGIYLRGTPQVQIWDYTKEGGKWDRGADKGSGGLFNNSKDAPGRDPAVLADKPFGEWNQFRIKQVGARTSVWLNGKHVVDHAIMENFWDRKKPLYAKGPIQLQTHGGEIRWDNLYIREISADEANKILREKNNEGFEPIFDGKTLNGWQGSVENYEVKNGSIVCKPGHGGTLFTKAVYQDFVVRLDFKLPPGGNNGLALRYPGKGSPYVDGMCELQVLDNTAGKYAKLDKRQYHGSVYGIIPAHRGYLRPVGEWNFQEVTVKGSTIKVELNGTVILDGDVSKVTEFMGDKPHPGKDIKEGHFGFAGHNDPVEFRNVTIKKL